MAKKTNASTSGSISKIEKDLARLKLEASKQNINAGRLVDWTNKEEIENKTRQELAKLITQLYFGILLLVMVGVPSYNLVAFALTNDSVYRLDLLDILQGYQALVGTLVGFVIAYYFKERTG